MTLSIHSPDELIAAVPHLLGFKAEESIVFVPLRPDLPLARVDLPTTASQRNEVWGAIRGAFSCYAPTGRQCRHRLHDPRVLRDSPPGVPSFLSISSGGVR
ncbi:DUF4192 family protein [Nocardioides sp. Y6]|uniref:DUF4192 family protein n=1 Tax=Nocardioides malaquae TaxID=2773426 RepID=A0ABR9RSL6_9ACTN|nr:DUF4192 family protein [Nocardioides malaquae]